MIFVEENTMNESLFTVVAADEEFNEALEINLYSRVSIGFPQTKKIYFLLLYPRSLNEYTLLSST